MTEIHFTHSISFDILEINDQISGHFPLTVVATGPEPDGTVREGLGGLQARTSTDFVGTEDSSEGWVSWDNFCDIRPDISQPSIGSARNQDWVVVTEWDKTRGSL